MLIVPVHGTFTVPAKGIVWFNHGSAVHKAILADGFDFAREEDPFEWSGDLDGMFAGKRVHSDWCAAGRSLRHYLKDIPFEDRNILTHSHGLQVALYAAAQGAKFRSLISVSGPVRSDMYPMAEKAKPNLGPWLAEHAPWDWVQTGGSICFDGHFTRFTRTHPFADQHIKIPKVGHSGLLSDPRYIPLLVREVLPFFRQEIK
jgi:hypothetical protein